MVHGAHLGPTGPRWAPCWPHEPCYLGIFQIIFQMYLLERKYIHDLKFHWDLFGSGNGLSPGFRQAIIGTNAGILLIWPLRTNFNEMLIVIHAFLQRLLSGNRSCFKRNLISVCTLTQSSGGTSCGLTNIKSNWNMFRSDWKCSTVHTYRLNQSKWTFL